MSRFFKALKQAELERAIRKQADRRDVNSTENASRAQTAVREEPPGLELPTRAETADVPPVLDLVVPKQFRDLEPEPATTPTRDVPAGIDPRLVSLLCPTSSEAEQYRVLRHMVEQKHHTANISVIAISSPASGDGKTITAINLAGALAQAPKARVLLVEADLRCPTMIDYLGLGSLRGKGLVDAILDPGLCLEDVVTRCPQFNLAVLPAGHPTSSSYEVLRSPGLEALLKEARQRYDYIVVDAPPLIPLPDCRLIGKLVDGFFLVVAANKTPRKLVEEALSLIDPAKEFGLVFNGDDRPLSGSYYSAYSPKLTPNGNQAGWWGRAVKRVGGSSFSKRP